MAKTMKSVFLLAVTAVAACSLAQSGVQISRFDHLYPNLPKTMWFCTGDTATPKPFESILGIQQWVTSHSGAVQIEERDYRKDRLALAFFDPYSGRAAQNLCVFVNLKSQWYLVAIYSKGIEGIDPIKADIQGSFLMLGLRKGSEIKLQLFDLDKALVALKKSVR